MFTLALAIGIQALALGQQPQSPPKGAPNAPSDDDLRTLATLHHDHGVQISLGQLAQQKGASRQVTQLGEQLVKDHREADLQLTEVAGKLGFDLTMPTPKDSAEAADRQSIKDRIARLNTAQDERFDRELASIVVDAHHRMISITEHALSQTRNSQLRGFYRQLLPVLTEQLRAAQALPRPGTSS
jgi:putative membrane protein